MGYYQAYQHSHMGVPEEEEKVKEAERLYEDIMVFPNFYVVHKTFHVL